MAPPIRVTYLGVEALGLLTPQTYEQTVSVGANDGYWIESTSSDNSDGYIYMGGTGGGYDNHNGFIRFTSLPIDQGIIIDSATLELTAAGSGSGTPLMWIYADKQANSGQIASHGDAAGRTLTTAYTVVTDSWSMLTTYQYDVKAVVQEIVNQVSWVSGNALQFLLMPQTGQFVAQAFENGSGIPNLTIDYLQAEDSAPSFSGTSPGRAVNFGGIGGGNLSRSRSVNNA